MQVNSVCANMLESIVPQFPLLSPAHIRYIRHLPGGATPRQQRFRDFYLSQTCSSSSSTLSWQACTDHRILSHEHSHLNHDNKKNMQIFTEMYYQQYPSSRSPRKSKVGNQNNAYLLYLLYQDNRQHLEHRVLHLAPEQQFVNKSWLLV